MRSNMRAGIIGLCGIVVTLGACATGMKGSARRACYDAGLQPGTPEFSNCWQGIARRDNAAALNSIVGAAVGYGIMQSAPGPALSGPGGNIRYSLVREQLSNTTDRLCQYENGTVLNVGSNMCPAYVGGR